MKLEDVTVQSAQEGPDWKTLGTSDDVHVKKSVAIVIGNPHIEALVKVLKMVTQASKCFEVYV
jgi:hypothetical protein